MQKRIVGQRSPAERIELVEKFLSSDVRQKEFCREHKIGLSTLQLWLSRYRRAQYANPSAPIVNTQVTESTNRQGRSFVPLTFTPSELATDDCRFIIEFPNHVIVRLAGPIDPHFLIQLIRAGGA